MGRGSAYVRQTLTAAGLALADLMDGPESGLCEYFTPAAAGGAIVPMIGGVTYIAGATINDAHATYTLADGYINGMRKGFRIATTVGNSKNFVVTVTSGIQADDSTALATITMNSQHEQTYLTWWGYSTGGKWKIDHSYGSTLATS
jgi:hypothetical protein